MTASRKARETPLLFHPGTEWEYGSNIDGVGQVVEAIAGKRLGGVMAVRPLGGQRRLGRAREPLLLDRPPPDIAGFWGTQTLPFLDGPSVTGHQDLETAAYPALSGW